MFESFVRESSNQRREGTHIGSQEIHHGRKRDDSCPKLNAKVRISDLLGLEMVEQSVSWCSWSWSEDIEECLHGLIRASERSDRRRCR